MLILNLRAIAAAHAAAVHRLLRLLVCLIAYAHLLQPSSAAAERVFSLLKNAFGEQQQSSLRDLVAATLMVQYNKRGLQ